MSPAMPHVGGRSMSPAMPHVGGRSMPIWAKLIIYALLVAVAWILTWDIGLFLILVISGGLTIWACTREKGNIVDLGRDLVFCLALLATAMAGPMNLVVVGFRGVGPAIWDAGQTRLDQWRGGTTPGQAPTPPAPQPAPGGPAPLAAAPAR